MNADISPATNKRILSIDILRGIIMVIMALDHTRDFFASLMHDPLDLSTTTPQLFLTRWITHYCAPVFVFLAGTSAFLSSGKHGSKIAAAGFLLKRGLWIIFLDIAIINLSWSFDISYNGLFVQVFWAIGWSMIFLAAIQFLKLQYIAALGLSIILFHNLLDPLVPQDFGAGSWLWMVFHEGGYLPFSETAGVYFAYPLLPWIGVMAAGYAFGAIFKKESSVRKGMLLKIGLACIGIFIALRFSNIYGNKELWVAHEVWWKSLLSFLDCTKYPPSLLFLLMTLGPAFIALSLLENVDSKLSRFFMVYGKVPMFYYLLHVPLIHVLAIIVGMMNGHDPSRFFRQLFFNQQDATWGFSLPFVYFIWLLVVLLLYYPCRWFMRLKARRKDWWLSYL